MRVRAHHVVLSGAVIAIGIMLGFAISFFLDAANTSHTYDAVHAHQVVLSGKTLGCAWVGHVPLGGSQPSAHVCRIGFDYRGSRFSELMAYNDPKSVYLDRVDPTLRMTKANFQNAPREINGDLVAGSALSAGAILVGTAHELHRRRRTRHSVTGH